MEQSIPSVCFICRTELPVLESSNFQIEDCKNESNYEFLCQLFQLTSILKPETNLGRIDNKEFCIKCCSEVIEAMQVWSQLKMIADQLDAIKISLQKKIIHSYPCDSKEYVASLNPKSSSEVIGRLLSQCWGKSVVSLPKMDINQHERTSSRRTSPKNRCKPKSRRDADLRKAAGVPHGVSDGFEDVSEIVEVAYSNGGFEEFEASSDPEWTAQDGISCDGKSEKRRKPKTKAKTGEKKARQIDSDNEDDDSVDSDDERPPKEERTYTCRVCNQVFERRKFLQSHLSDSHQLDIMNLCQHCGHDFTSDQTKAEEDSYKCHLTGCDKSFPSVAIIRKHHVTKCPDNPRVKIRAQGVRHKCELCDKSYLYITNLRDHVASKHENNFKFCCDQCGSGFQSKGQFDRHIRHVHTAEKAHECEFCGKRFKSRDQWKYHRRIHTGERPFICDECGKGFTRPQKLREHKQNLHNPPFIPCPFCDKLYPSDHYLRNHVEGFHKKNPAYMNKPKRKCVKDTKETVMLSNPNDMNLDLTIVPSVPGNVGPFPVMVGVSSTLESYQNL